MTSNQRPLRLARVPWRADQSAPGAVPDRYGFERIPVEPLALLLVFLVCAQTLGAVIVMLELLVLGLLLVLRWRDWPGLLITAAALLALPLYAMFSALWSSLPAVSLRYGAQLVITVMIAIAIARSVPLSRMAAIVLIATLAATAIGIAMGRTGPSPTGPVPIGLAGSKNQLGYTVLFTLIAALAVLPDPRQSPWLRVLAGLSLVPVFHLLITSQVVTALVLGVVAVAVTGLLLLFRALRPQARMLALVAAALLPFAAIVAAPQLTEFGDRFRSDTLGKDDRLTGRTLLWEAADDLIAERPLLGHGYRAVWMGEAGSGLLARFGLRDGRTFNFHSTVIELRADLGIGGVALLAITLLVGWARLFRLLGDAITPGRIFLTLALLVLTARMFTELVIAPFLLDTVVLYAVLAALLRDRPASAPVNAPMHRWRPRRAVLTLRPQFARITNERSTVP